MRVLPYALAIGVVLAVLLFLGFGSASAQSQPRQGYGGGYVQGWVYGYTMYDELIPLNWVPVTASSSEYNFTAYTWNNGGYEMYLPAGTFNMSVYEPGYKPYSTSITISDGSSINGFNFYLEQSHVPIPEFPTQLFSMVMMAFAIAATLIAKRAIKRRKQAG